MQRLEVYLDGNETPVEVLPLGLYVWEYEEAGGRAEFGLRLWCAYSQIEDRSPKNMAEVKAWAKDRKVMVQVGAAVDPTRTGRGGGSSPK